MHEYVHNIQGKPNMHIYNLCAYYVHMHMIFFVHHVYAYCVYIHYIDIYIMCIHTIRMYTSYA